MIDYHVHTDSSMDCKTPMAEMCARALELGVREIAFTDHLNSHMLDMDISYYDPERYFRDIEYCRRNFPALTILAGIEVGEPHRWTNKVVPIVTGYPYDVVLGSLHWLGNDSLFDANYYRAAPPEKTYGAYFTELARMIEFGGFDVLAHVDLPKRVGYTVYGTVPLTMLEDMIRPVWDVCVKYGITPEINTKSMRMSVHEMHPNTEVLRWYVEAGGRNLTVGSDAHNTRSLGEGFAEASQSAQQAGITSLSRFQGRRIVGQMVLNGAKN